VKGGTGKEPGKREESTMTKSEAKKLREQLLEKLSQPLSEDEAKVIERKIKLLDTIEE
jgi:hypothetical protein